jgi:hypothetical protein
VKILNPLNHIKRPLDFRRVYAFDIETQNNNREFLCGALVHLKEKPIIFMEKEKMKEHFLNMDESNTIIATNLEFDAGQLFGHKIGEDIIYKPFEPFYNNSILICGRLKTNNNHNLKFIDSYNSIKSSVETMGKLINMPKLNHPPFEDGLTVLNKKEWLEYCIRDAEITLNTMKYLSDFLFKMGGKMKMTIASSTNDLYRRKYMPCSIIRPDKEFLEMQRLGYYGGRTEAFCRGKINDYFYYDVNSMYPFVMLNEYPNPNTMQYTEKGNINNILDFNGISLVKMKTTTEMFYPLLPFRTEKKLIFPCSKEGFWSWQNHLEIREAIINGYELQEIKNQFFYTENFKPFEKFVLDLYPLKAKYRKEGNKLMEILVKILLNSQYGKWGQKSDKTTEIKFIDDIDFKVFENFDCEKLGQYIIVKREMTEKEISAHINPILALHTTSMARLHLYKLLKHTKGIYADTDSIISDKKISVSNDLGDLKLEKEIEEGLIISPKMYYVNDEVKMKGIPRATIKEIHLAINHKPVIIYKLSRIRENMRSLDNDKYPNKPKVIFKNLCLEDNKRYWTKKFDAFDFQTSKPLYI